MPDTLEALEAEAMKLSPADRRRLLERLVASLDLDPAVEHAWDAVADQRERELACGTTVAVAGPEAIARLRAQLTP